MKSQVSIFMILGLAMLFALIFIFFITIYSTSVPPVIEGTPPFYVQSCLENAVKQSVLEYGAFGSPLIEKYHNISIGYKDSQILLQPESDMLRTVTENTKRKNDDCTHQTQDRFTIIGNSLLTVSIKEDKIMALLQQKIEYKTGERTTSRTNFRYELPTRFLKTFRLMHQKIEDFHNTKLIRSTRTMEQMNQGNYSISYIPDDRFVILEIIDKQDTFNTEPFRFYSVIEK